MARCTSHGRVAPGQGEPGAIVRKPGRGLPGRFSVAISTDRVAELLPVGAVRLVAPVTGGGEAKKGLRQRSCRSAEPDDLPIGDQGRSVAAATRGILVGAGQTIAGLGVVEPGRVETNDREFPSIVILVAGSAVALVQPSVVAGALPDPGGEGRMTCQAPLRIHTALAKRMTRRTIRDPLVGLVGRCQFARRNQLGPNTAWRRREEHDQQQAETGDP